MNRRRPGPDRRSLIFPLAAVVLAALVATTGGAMHAINRNGQIQLQREIARVEKRIAEHKRDIQLIEVRRERLLDRYEIRETLRTMDSELVPVRHGVVETIRPDQPRDPGPVASRS